MQVVASNKVVNVTGNTLSRERTPVIRRESVLYEHVREQVIVPRPRIEDFNALVVVHDKVEYYS